MATADPTIGPNQSYSPGGEVELYLSAGLCLPLGLFYLIMTLANLFGELLGSKGQRFIFEMDAVMGGLLGIPHYSKVEAVLLGFSSLGCFLTWSPDLNLSFVAVLGILVGAVYLLICTFYAIVARQTPVFFLVFMLVDLGLLVWRCVSFLHPDFHITVIVCSSVGAVLSVLSFIIMRTRAERCEPAIVKLLQLQKFEEQLKEKKEVMVWLRGREEPEGFSDAAEGGLL